MAGGSGERFWPRSRLSRPKHLLPIVGDRPMLAQTLGRLDGLVPPERTWVITNGEQAEAVRRICPELDPEKIVAEPLGRDTAPAVALAALLVRREGGDGAFAMLPADHVIHDGEAFRADLASAFAAAERAPVIATIGIEPTFPATGYGYIEAGAGREGCFAVNRFVEKPDPETARAYLESGGYFWNGGIFVWRPSTILGALAEFRPELHRDCAAIGEDLEAGAPLEKVLAMRYPGLEKISIDYAVMEKARNVVMIRSTFDWDDVGSWPAIGRHHPKDGSGNAIRGAAAVEDAADNIVYAEDGHLVGLIGVSGLVVVQTPDATLVCPRERAQDVKKLVRSIRERKDGERYLR
ncbi:MAG: mannose-1-phosphate guanylyltransferase [Puniceicoccaceae bacterium]